MNTCEAASDWFQTTEAAGSPGADGKSMSFCGQPVLLSWTGLRPRPHQVQVDPHPFCGLNKTPPFLWAWFVVLFRFYQIPSGPQLIQASPCRTMTRWFGSGSWWCSSTRFQLWTGSVSVCQTQIRFYSSTRADLLCSRPTGTVWDTAWHHIQKYVQLGQQEPVWSGSESFMNKLH